MDINEVKRLVKLVEASDIEELKIEEKDFKIRITKSKEGSPQQTIALPLSAVPPLQPLPTADTFQHKHQEAPIKEASPGDDSLVEICSPMVGTFYRAPSPDTEPYVKVGDKIEPGQILCIIEAMKLMNELEAEVSGEIVKILVDNAQPVEYNQPIFMIKKA